MPWLWTALVAAVGVSCAHRAPEAQQKKAAAADERVVQESFMTRRDTLDNADSPVVWHGPSGEDWLLVTAKATDAVLVYDAATGEALRRVGGPGEGAGRFRRPNSLGVAGDLLLVVERDNRRVQVLRLPEFEPLGYIGGGVLRRPYGMALVGQADGRWDLYVTDNYETPDERIPPPAELGQRVRRFRFWQEDGGLASEDLGAFGDTQGAGVLHKVESLWADPAHDRLLVADEHEVTVKVYDLDGRFSGEVWGSGVLRYEPEGIALYACGAEGGYWVVTDQDDRINRFHLFARGDGRHLGHFSGAATRNTDGIALSQAAFGPFGRGAFYAVHDDGNVAAFAWEDVARAVGVRDDCTAPRPTR